MKNIKKGQFDETPFETILSSEILTKEDLDSLEPLKNELRETFLKSQVFRTRTEMEVSVLNDTKFPTPSSKYWQATREQNVMFNELVNASFEYRKTIVDIKIIKRKIEKEDDDLEEELLRIELDKKLFSLRHQEKIAKDRIREIKAWSEIKERESAEMTNEELDNVDNHQLVSYTKRWIRQTLSSGNNGSPSEKNNLAGQLKSGINECIKRGLQKDLLSDIRENEKQFLINNVGIKI